MGKRWVLIEAAEYKALAGRVASLEYVIRRGAGAPQPRLELRIGDRSLFFHTMYCQGLKWREITEGEALAVPRLILALAEGHSGRGAAYWDGAAERRQLSFFGGGL